MMVYGQIQNLDALLDVLGALRLEHGNVPVAVSVSQEDRGQVYNEPRDIVSMSFSRDGALEIRA